MSKTTSFALFTYFIFQLKFETSQSRYIMRRNCLAVIAFTFLMNSLQAQFTKSIKDISANGEVVESEIHWYRYDEATQSITKIRETYGLFDEAGRQLEDKTVDLTSGRTTTNNYTWKEDGKPSELLVAVQQGEAKDDYFAKFSHLFIDGLWATYEISGSDTVIIYNYQLGSPEKPERLEVYDFKTKTLKRRESHLYHVGTEMVNKIELNHFEEEKVVASETVEFDQLGFRTSYELKGQRKEILERDEFNGITKTFIEIQGKLFLTSESSYAYDGQDNWTKVYRTRYGQNGEVVEELFGFKKTKKWYKTPMGSVEPNDEFIALKSRFKKN